MTHYTISIVSDTICPWCYIGHRRLSRAIRTHLSKHPSDTFSYQWHPFQLNPKAPTPSVPRQAYYASRFGPEQAQAYASRLAEVGRAENIPFKSGGRMGNTRDSHRLIEHARTKESTYPETDKERAAMGMGLQTRVVEELFKDFFEREQDITDRGVLARAAGRAGMDEDEVRKMLDSEEHGALVDEEVAKARGGGVNGVPNFTINDQYEVEGAQEDVAFLSLFERVKRKAGKV